MAQMTPEQRDAFLARPRIAKLVTLYADGSPTAVPVWFEWDGGQARIFTGRTSEKARRIRADPRVCLTVDVSVGEPEAWVTLEGTAEIEEHGAIELARRLPPGLQLDTWQGRGFVAIALVQTRGLRPVGLPARLGQDFFLSGYRIFARFTPASGRQRTLRGLRILRSDTDRRLMVLFG